MAFSIGDDINVLQHADSAQIGAGAGNDTYILSPHTLRGGEQITVSDTLGTNSLQLLSGLEIRTAQVASNALKLTLDKSAVINGQTVFTTITILGANLFKYEPGGNVVSGIDNPDVDFTTFVTDTLGLSVPQTGTVTGGPITIGGGPVGNIVTLPVGSSATVSATSAAEVFALNVTNAYASSPNTQLALSGFTTTGDNVDALRFDLPGTAGAGATHLDQLNGVSTDASRVISVQVDPFANSTLINFGPDADGQLVTLNLVGVTDASTVSITVI